MVWKRLLVPHDFSECAAHALTLAVDVARVFCASVTVLHVSELPSNLDPAAVVHPPGGQPLRAEDYAKWGVLHRLDALVEPYRTSGIPFEVQALFGEVTESILSTATGERFDAIVMGTHGRTALAHLWMGSIAENVVRRASVPVVTTRFAAPPALPTREEQALEDELAG